MKFWRRKHKKPKSVPDEENVSEESVSTDIDETQAEPDTEEDGSDTATGHESVDTETANGEEDEITEPQEGTEDDVSGNASEDIPENLSTENEQNDSAETSITKTGVSNEETDIAETTEDDDEYYEDTQSGVFIFGKKIDGTFRKVIFAILAITLIPPTFLFSIALLVCVALLIFPLITVILIATFPATIFSFFILMAVLPVAFPAILIFLLITGKGKLSAFAEGKLLVLKLFKWTLPTI
ncbi:MAG: hypothetical protein ACUZ8H_01955 [Candidatus Anammoxibacter sp.]